MLSWGILFLVIALVAGALGFFALAGVAATAAKIVLAVFLIGFVLTLIFGKRRIFR